MEISQYHTLYLWAVLIKHHFPPGRPARTTKSELTTTEDNTLEEKPQLIAVTSSTQ